MGFWDSAKSVAKRAAKSAAKEAITGIEKKSNELQRWYDYYDDFSEEQCREEMKRIRANPGRFTSTRISVFKSVCRDRGYLG